MKTIKVTSHKRESMIEITANVERAISANSWTDGILTIFTPHTTAAITINENADPDVTSDIIRFLNKEIPESYGFRHNEGNSDAHIKSSFFGCSEQVIIENGKMILGTWQGIYFCDFDGPRTRQVHLKYIS